MLAPSNETFTAGDGPLPNLPLTRQWRYPYFWALGCTAALHFGTGVAMMKASKKRQASVSCIHHVVALTISWPVMLTVFTGVAYRLLRMHGFEDVKWSRVLHAGYFTTVVPYYPLFICATVVMLTLSGMYLYVAQSLRSQVKKTN